MMKKQIYCSDQIEKNFEFNQNQTEVGSKLKTYKGSPIQRSKYGVGKQMSDSIYVHKNYADKIVSQDILQKYKDVLESKFPNFQYNCLKIDTNRNRIAFQESPDFDTAREPIVGDWIAIEFLDDELNKCKVMTGHSNYIFHHKWLWVGNDYTGFDVQKSWEWSKRWLSTLKETSDGNGINRWTDQLDKYNLPHDDQ